MIGDQEEFKNASYIAIGLKWIGYILLQTFGSYCFKIQKKI